MVARWASVRGGGTGTGGAAGVLSPDPQPASVATAIPAKTHRRIAVSRLSETLIAQARPGAIAG